MTQLQGKESEISVCTMEKNQGNWPIADNDPKGYLSIDVINMDQLEYILPARLLNETFSGIMNFIKATQKGTSRDQTQTALVRHLAQYSN